MKYPQACLNWCKEIPQWSIYSLVYFSRLQHEYFILMQFWIFWTVILKFKASTQMLILGELNKCRWRYFKSRQIQCFNGAGRWLQASGTSRWKQRLGPFTSFQRWNNDRKSKYDPLKDKLSSIFGDYFHFLQNHSSRYAAHVHIHAAGSVCFMYFVSGSLW